MNDLGLQKYIIEGMIQDELMNEEKPKTNKDSKNMDKNNVKELLENLLKEFEMASSPDPNQDLSPKIATMLLLSSAIRDNIYKLRDLELSNFEYKLIDDKTKDMLRAQFNNVINTLIQEITRVWSDKELDNQPTPPKPDVDPTTVLVIGQDVTTPQNETLKIVDIQGDKIILEDITKKKKIVNKNIILKWIK